MSTSPFTLGTTQFSLPEGWDVSPDGKSFEIESQFGYAQLYGQETAPESTPPFGDVANIYPAIHQHSIDDDSGLIEVIMHQKSDSTTVGFIFKRRLLNNEGQMSGTVYTSQLFVCLPGTAYQMNFEGRERNTTGVRDSAVMSQLLSSGEVTSVKDPITGKDHITGWSRDPYDENFVRGFLMNKSEEKRFDQQFPEHPLSLIRNAADMLIQTIHLVEG